MADLCTTTHNTAPQGKEKRRPTWPTRSPTVQDDLCGRDVSWYYKIMHPTRIEILLLKEQKRKIENLETRMKKLEDALAV